jgi:hypothetical protein
MPHLPTHPHITATLSGAGVARGDNLVQRWLSLL